MRLTVNHSKLIFIFSSLILAVIGLWYVLYTWNTNVTAVAEEAIKLAEVAVSAFPKSVFGKLAVDASDIERKEYQDIKANLMSIKNVNAKVRFAYVYIQRQGKVLFVADSEPVYSNDYSPPGQEYTEVSSENLKPFKDGLPYITKPVTDRWGNWVSVLVPIKEQGTNVPVAVFGMDYPAANWNTAAKFHTAQAVVVVLSLYVLLFAFFALANANRKAKENEKNYKTFFETIDDIVVVGDAQGNLYYVNNAASRKLGYSEKELLAMRILDLNPKDKQKEAEQIFGEMLAGTRNSCPLPLEKKDGTILPVETRIWFGKWNDKDCIFGISKDLGKEQELLQKFNKIFENNPSLMAISSLPDRKFTDVNEAFLTTLGYSKEEIIGKTADDLNLFVNPDEQKRVGDVLGKTRFIHNIELQVRTKSGAILAGLFSGEIFEIQGKQYFLTVMVDQTKNIYAKNEMEKKNAELESMNKVMVNREIKMIELKKEIEKLKSIQTG